MANELTKILVCDDDADIAAAVSIYLRAEGYEVLCASNGREALEICEREPLSLLILDIMMPEMDGIAALTAEDYARMLENARRIGCKLRQGGMTRAALAKIR